MGAIQLAIVLALLHRLFCALQRLVQTRLRGFVQLLGPLRRFFFDAVDQTVQLVASLNVVPSCFILAGVLLRLLDHFLDLGVSQSGGSFDSDLLFLFGRSVLR